MIPDTIQANIMKYLNNGVSGSSQAQKPVKLATEYEQEYNYFTLTNNYTTDDKQFIVNMGMYRDTPGSTERKPYVGVFNVENALQGEAYAFYKIPNYNNYEPSIPYGSINRDEDGRFYGIISYKINETTTNSYLVIFNDFIEDGILLINKAYRLINYTFTGPDGISRNFNTFSYVIKKEGSSEYILYDNYTKNNYFYIGILKINVETTNEIKVFYKQLNDTTNDNFISTITISNNSQDTYGLITYQNNNNGITTRKIVLKESTDTLTEIINNYTSTHNNETIIYKIYANYNNNGIYVEYIGMRKTNNTYTFQFYIERVNGSTTSYSIPSLSITTTDEVNVDYSVFENLLFLRVYTSGDINYKKLYQITENVIKFATDIVNVNRINFDRIEVLKQFNLYYCFAFNPTIQANVFIVRDVPTYGRDCLLKQKLFNSKLFRIIKKYRNKRTNI